MESPGNPIPAPSAAADREAADLVHYLATRDAACPLCGYNLRCLTRPQCPECGRELRLTVGLTEPYLRAWITLLAATCAAGGTGVFFTLLFVGNGWPRVNGPPVKAFLLNAAVLYFMSCVPIAAAQLLTRRRFIKMPQGRQWALAWAAVAATSSAIVAFAALVN